jgi:hypothetical protein
MKDFSEDGLSFSYPDDWRLEREPGDDGWTVTLQSPGSAFAMVTMDRDLPEPADVASAALEALQEDYPKLEAESSVDMLAGEMAVGHDIQFFTLDLATTCWTRSFHGAAGTVLVLCQVSDLDQEIYEPALRVICSSMRTETE